MFLVHQSYDFLGGGLGILSDQPSFVGKTAGNLVVFLFFFLMFCEVKRKKKVAISSVVPLVCRFPRSKQEVFDYTLILCEKSST